jgi:hypothetical protein
MITPLPPHQYNLEQVLVDPSGDQGIVIGLRYDLTEWEYWLYYPHLKVMSYPIPEKDLSTHIVDTPQTPDGLVGLPQNTPTT